MNIKKLSELSGVSVRSLHHYDELGLLVPQRRENGYREYGSQELERLQHILLFRGCGFPLKTIKDILENPTFHAETAFRLQRQALLHERKRLDGMIQNLEATYSLLQKGETMSDEKRFKNLDLRQNPYEEEAKKLWGEKAVSQSQARLNKLSQAEQGDVAQGMEELFVRLAALQEEDPAGEAAQKAMAEMYAFYNENFGYHYSYEAFRGLGEMYVADERFTKNIDAYGEGLSRFLKEAMAIFATNHQK